ncbi:hypothetical protein [Paenibacillus rhizophilus]|uniref:Uncharacterized protein n=1 Tax=Paenibacillus rhizophilus TaxID=1850366 RepID=A0A3N9PD13_9BACL|nr:hypothetical protein [Paenibacillus rhizophilus]RQW13505.1 hypothetical protein EH198_03535 [Paenibacillus rhizophilus]
MGSSSPQSHTIIITLPDNTPQTILAYLEQLKQSGERTFSNKITQLLIESLNQACLKEKPHVVLPLPEHLTEEQQDWFNHPFTKQLLMNWISQLTSGMPSFSSSNGLSNGLAASLTQPEISEVPLNTETDITASQSNHDSFRISTSYHNKLVGFFLDED